MPETRTTLAELLAGEPPGAAGDPRRLAGVLAAVADAVKEIAAAVAKGALAAPIGAAGDTNGRGERRAELDVLANDLLLRACARSGELAGMVSAELDAPCPLPAGPPRGELLLVLDPLDRSPNLDVNLPAGTIFSILRRAEDGAEVAARELLRPGLGQVCAGYAIYGPSTMVVLTLGRGVHGFTLDRDAGELYLTHPDLRVPDATRELAVNASGERFWEPPVQRYVAECLAGTGGPRREDFDVRWTGSLVAEVHRILQRGGLFLHPRDTKEPPRAGRLRLLHAASPMAMLVEAAGGAASTGRERILELQPTAIHERVPMILGSRAEVQRLVRYHREHDLGEDHPFRSPLFGTRSLFLR